MKRIQETKRPSIPRRPAPLDLRIQSGHRLPY